MLYLLMNRPPSQNKKGQGNRSTQLPCLVAHIVQPVFSKVKRADCIPAVFHAPLFFGCILS
ncbi:MAG: hypothetical protein IJ174_09350, partial [Clostridia bacterium]|nr:hypothetical protein [Clostridia bacterium]